MRLVPSNMLYIISTIVRSGLPTGGLPQCREVGSIQQVIYIISTIVRSGYRQVVYHDVVRLVPSNRLYIISMIVRSGLPTGGFPRCREVGSIQQVIYIISTVVRSGLPTGGFPRCREVGSIQQVIYYFHGREVGFTDRWFPTMS